jgi:hypothetical protein
MLINAAVIWPWPLPQKSEHAMAAVGERHHVPDALVGWCRHEFSECSPDD